MLPQPARRERIARTEGPGLELRRRPADERARVCLITETFYPVIGGGETQALGLSEDLARAGHSVIVVTRRSHEDLPGAESLRGFEVRRLGPTGPGQIKKWAMLPGITRLLIARRHDYDIILVSGYRVLGIAASLVADRFGKKCVLKADNSGEMSGDYFDAGIDRLRLGWARGLIARLVHLRNVALNRCAHFVALSSEMETELLSHGIEPEKITTIPNGYDPARFAPLTSTDEKRRLRRRLGLPSDGRLAIFTGRLLRAKGVPLLLQVWGDLSARYPDWTLLVVGAGAGLMGSCEEELRERVRGSGLDSRVVFTGSVRNVEDYLRASDMFVFPTENEAFGISLIEAMACGLPCIASAVGGVKDIIQDGINGLLIQPRDSEGLSRRLEQLLADAGLADRLGGQAAKDALERYARQSVARSYMRLFERLMQ